VLHADLHSKRIHLNGLIETVADETLHLLDNCNLMHPDTGKVRLAISDARHRGGEVGFAVASTRRSWRLKVQPLCRRDRGGKWAFAERHRMSSVFRLEPVKPLEYDKQS